MKNSKNRKSGWLAFNLLLFLVIALSVLAVKSQSLNIGKKAAGGDGVDFATLPSLETPAGPAAIEKINPANKACLKSKNVQFLLKEATTSGNYPLDAYFAVYNAGGNVLAKSGWLNRVIAKAETRAKWVYNFTADGTYSWRGRLRNTQGILNPYDRKPFILGIDTTAPSLPSKCFAQPVEDSSVSNARVYKMYAEWQAGTDTGCGSVSPILYEVQYSLTPDFSQSCATHRKYTTKDSANRDDCFLHDIAHGYVRVRARDSVGNWSDWVNCHWPN